MNSFSQAPSGHTDRQPARWPQIWYGSATANEASVYLRVTDDSFWQRAARAVIRGPFCEKARTLPASFSFQADGPSLWTAPVLDPSFWCPDFPALYRVQWNDEEPLESIAKGANSDKPFPRPEKIHRELALRQWGTRGSDLWLNGAPWVFRAIQTPHAPESPSLLQEQLLSVVVNELDPLWLILAARSGVSVAFRPLGDDPAAIVTQIEYAAQWPAVMLAILPATLVIDRRVLREAAPNLLFVADFTARQTANDAFSNDSNWSDVALVSDDQTKLRAFRAQHPHRPLIVARSSPHAASDVAQARRQCEQLQRDLIESFDLSGYLVEYLT